MPNQTKVIVGTVGLTLLLGCGEKEAEVVAPVAEAIGQPVVEQATVPPSGMAGVDESNKEPASNEAADVTTAKEFRASDSLDVEAFREQVTLEISKKDEEG